MRFINNIPVNYMRYESNRNRIETISFFLFRVQPYKIIVQFEKPTRVEICQKEDEKIPQIPRETCFTGEEKHAL